MTSAPLFKKKGLGKRDVRTRDLERESEETHIGPSGQNDGQGRSTVQHDPSAVVIKKRRTAGVRSVRNTLLQTGTPRRRWEGDAEMDADTFGDDDLGTSGGASSSARLDATRSSTWYDDDHARSEGTAQAKGANFDGLYHGAQGYSNYVAPQDDGKSSKARTAKGPMRDSNVRTVTMFDYNPESCKSYKETGYCGFGDTCKFLHDRSDYLKGWQLDAMPDSTERQRSNLGSAVDGKKKGEEELPFACLICRKPFTDPVVTKCGHYFCETCALKRYTKNSKCFACGKRTDGLFQRADKILRRMEQAQTARKEEEDDRNWASNADADTADHVQTSGQLLDGVEIG